MEPMPMENFLKMPIADTYEDALRPDRWTSPLLDISKSYSYKK